MEQFRRHRSAIQAAEFTPSIISQNLQSRNHNFTFANNGLDALTMDDAFPTGRMGGTNL